jgi:O-antigen ligase
MASELVLARPRSFGLTAERVIEIGFVGFLLLVFIGLTPFAPRLPAALMGRQIDAEGQGDALRQVLYLTTFAIIAFGAWRKFGLQAIALVPAALSLALIWCVASSLWAVEGGVTFRRAGLEGIVVLSAIWGTHTLGVERTLRLLRWVLATVLIVNWLAIPLFANAVHLPGEPDPGLVGDWRGLYFHKNIAGAVSAVSALLFLYFALEKKSRIDWLLFVGAAAFTVMTKSKSSMALLPLAIVVAAIYRLAWKRGIDRGIAVLAAVLIVVLGSAVALTEWDWIVRTISDPQEFTGRTAIWQAEAAYIADHPIFGAGYGSFTDTGGISPLHAYVGGGWIEAIAHGHNGYLQLALETGLVGLGLSLIALVLQPALALWRRDQVALGFRALVVALFVFLVLHNFLESDFLQGDAPAWVAMLITVAMLKQARA